MLAQVVGASSSSGFGELGPGPGLLGLGSTLVVVLLLVVTLLVLRVVYMRRRGPRGGGALAVISQVELAPGQSLYLVRAAGRCLLIGGTGSGLGLVAELDPAAVAAAGSLAGARAGTGTVAERLRAQVFGAAEPLDRVETVAPADHVAPPRGADLKVS